MVQSQEDTFLCGQFPTDFKWGLSTTAYAVEGGWDQDGKGDSICDTFYHKHPDKSNGDVAANSYEFYKKDIELLKNMGANTYGFSISWSRLLPAGTGTIGNPLGVYYYNCLIKECLGQGLRPVVTLFCWDTPAALEDQGGWLSPEMVGWFRDYARLCFKYFGDRVKDWITLRDPATFARDGYGGKRLAPAHNEPTVEPYAVMHHMLQAHAEAYQLYVDEFKEVQEGKVGITLSADWYAPMDPNSELDVEAAQRALHFSIGWTANPLFNGDYPAVMKEYLEKKSKAEGRADSRLPKFDKDSASKIKGSVDFIGINAFGTFMVTHKPSCAGQIGSFFDQNVRADSAEIVPSGLRSALCWIQREYSNPEILITGTGIGSAEVLEDTIRAQFFRSSINEVLKAIHIDRSNVQGYLGYSLIDGFALDLGYTVNYGVHQVDFDTGKKTRVPKDSAKELTRIFKVNGFSK